MNEKFITVKEVSLKNNCPECYSTEGLTLTFKQKFKESRFYKSITADIVEELVCSKCDTTIYPVSWTDDIERVYDYQKKALIPKPKTIKLKRLGFIIFIALDLIALAIILVVFFPDLIGLS